MSALAIDEYSSAHHVEVEGAFVLVDVVGSRIYAQATLRMHSNARFFVMICHNIIVLIVLSFDNF